MRRFRFIGTLYGIQANVAGRITHLFHGVVLGTVFVAAPTVDSLDHCAETLSGTDTLGIPYGVLLLLVAAGVVVGAWLDPVGIPASIPNLGTVSPIGHTARGALIGVPVSVLPTEFG